MWNKYGIDYKKDTNDTRVLKVLEYNKGKKVNVWKLINASKVCHYTDAIATLRKKGYVIKNETKHKGRVMTSNYILG